MEQKNERMPRIFVLPKKNTKPSKKGVDYPPAVTIPAVDEIYEETKDPQTGKLVGRKRIIQYVQGERSIYKDEQAKDAKPSKIPPIIKGHIFIDFRESQLIEFLEKCDYNGSKKDRDPKKDIIFKEVKKGQSAAEFVEKERQEWEVRDKIFNMSIDEKEALAMIFKINNWDKMLSDELTRELLVLARRNTKAFYEKLSDASVKKLYSVLKAEKEGFIKLDKHNCVAYWDGGREICRGTLSDDIEQYIVKHFESARGQEDYAHLLEKLYPNRKTQKSNKPSDLDQIIDAAVEDGVIVQKGLWFYFGEEGDAAYFKIQGKKNLAKHIEADEDLKATIASLILSA